MTRQLYVVETITNIVSRYVVEAKSLEHAYDEVTMLDSGAEDDYFEPVMSITAGSEMVVDGREITMDEFKKLQDHPESNSPWMGEKLIRKIIYEEDKGTDNP